MRTREIYAIEFIERDPQNLLEPKVVFTKVLPMVPLGMDYTSRKQLEEHINACTKMTELDKQVTLTGIAFACDWWFPKNFYRIATVQWKG